jgi:excisionase family DNA binding protein
MANNPNEPKWLSVTQCAQDRNCHPNTIRNAIKSGKLPAVRFGRNIIRINQADLEALFTPYQGGEFGQWS